MAKEASSGMTVSEAGRKGGSAKVAKGFAKMAKDRVRELARAGAASRKANRSAKASEGK